MDVDRTSSGDDDAWAVRGRLRRSLGAAMKARDAVAVAALRSALAAIDNAEAVDAQPPGAGPPVLVGLGAAEVERRQLTAAQVEDIVRREVADREAAAGAYERAGRHARAERLRGEAEALVRALGA